MEQSIYSHILGLQVILPLLSAIVCSLIKKSNISWYYCLIITLIILGLSVKLGVDLLGTSSLVYYMGGWLPSYGIQLKLDALNFILLILTSIIAVSSIIYAKEVVPAEIPSNKISWFYTCFLLCYSGMIGMILTNDAFNLYVFLEITSLSTYTLIALGNKKAAVRASFEYLIIGTMGATFYLIGIGFLYGLTGSINISEISAHISALPPNKALLTGVIFIITGLSVKSALFPLHIWLTKAYYSAPSFVTVFLSGTATKVNIYILIKYIFCIFGSDIIFKQMHFGILLSVLSLSAIICSSVYALAQKSLKHVLAYSSVSQIGYIILGVSLNTKIGLTAALFTIILHSLAKTTLFMYACTSKNIHSLPKLHFFIAASSLVGVPCTGGFISKLYLLQAAADLNYWLIFALIIIGSFITFLYMWKISQIHFFTTTESGPASLSLNVLISFLSLMILLLGVFPTPLIKLIDNALPILGFSTF